MAPLSIGWEDGHPLSQVCYRILDPTDNGHRIPEQIAEHIAYDRQFVASARLPARNIQGVQLAAPSVLHNEFAQPIKQ